MMCLKWWRHCWSPKLPSHVCRLGDGWGQSSVTVLEGHLKNFKTSSTVPGSYDVFSTCFLPSSKPRGFLASKLV